VSEKKNRCYGESNRMGRSSGYIEDQGIWSQKDPFDREYGQSLDKKTQKNLKHEGRSTFGKDMIPRGS
jgi:hypothetical protein